MSALYNHIRAEWVAARQGRIELKATALGTIISDLDRIAKDEQREVRDSDVFNLALKYIKGINETLDALLKNAPSDVRIPRIQFEKTIYQELLPSQLTPDEIKKIIQQNHLTGVKDIMTYFKHHYVGRYDGKVLSEIARTA